MSLPYVFFGTPEFCIPVLEVLTQAGRNPLAIVCQPDRPKGRGCVVCSPPTKNWAKQRSVLTLQPSTCMNAAFLKEITDLQPDLGLVFAYGQRLPKQLLELLKMGFINIHPSLLPRYRGAAPVHWALIHGESTTGVSIVKMTPRLDDGEIILQESVRIGADENAIELGERLALVGAELVVKALELLENKKATFTPQDEKKVIWAPALKKEDGKIDWSESAKNIHNRIRGVQPWPGASTRLGNKQLKIHRATPGEATFPEAKPGQVVVAEGDDLVVCTGDGTLRLLEVQPEGKKRMQARAFLLGRRIHKGNQLH